MVIKKPSTTSTKKTGTTSTKKTGTTSSSGSTTKKPTSGSTSGSSSAVKKPTGSTTGSVSNAKKPSSGGSSSSKKSGSKSGAKPGMPSSSKVQSQPTAKQDIGKKQPFDGKGSSDKSIKPFSENNFRADYDKYLYPELSNAEMRMLAKGSRLTQDVFMSLKHEGKPSHLSDEKYLHRFARYRWDEEETKQAHRMLKLWEESMVRRLAQDREASTPIPEFVDPCAAVGEFERRRCYLQAIRSYGVDIINDADVQNHPEVLSNLTFDQFSLDQLTAILEGIYLIDASFAASIEAAMGISLNQGEAFRYIYGPIEFGYAPAMETGETRPTGDPTDLTNPIYIILDDSSFAVAGQFHRSFVPVHELGHAFSNRFGGQAETYDGIAGKDFVGATGSYWAVDDPIYVFQSIIGGVPLNPYQDTQGNYLTIDGRIAQSQSEWVFVIPEPYYIAVGYSTGESGLYPNELRDGGSNPSEGFADAFANYFLHQELWPNGTLRQNYIDSNISAWLTEMYFRQPSTVKFEGNEVE